ncbi:MAG: PLDc N-terminal domain-containing protein [Actinobacteria bacterium]|nr:PLDc N-terminal domain-containing protein [Actinomycetota bacterium]
MLVGIFFFVVWILMLIDCIKRKENEFPEGGENAKTIWLIVLIATWAVGFSWLAAILYYFMVVRKMPRSS